jgi:mono/diheme cytochrome c family protein
VRYILEFCGSFCRSGKPGVLATATVLLLLVAAAAPIQAQQAVSKTNSAPAGNIVKGKENFKKFGCSACHGYTAQGGTGPRLAQNSITYAAFVRYVSRPKRSMPPYGDQLKESELADIFTFIKSVPPSPAPKNIPMLNE